MLMMVAFRMHITSPENWDSFLPPGTVVADVVVTPGWGIYGFIIAAGTALALNNVVIVAHRNASVMDESERRRQSNATKEKSLSPEQSPPATRSRRESWFDNGTRDIPIIAGRTRAATLNLVEQREAVMRHTFHIPGQHAYHLRISALGQISGIGLVAAAFICTFVGSVIPTFLFEFHGMCP